MASTPATHDSAKRITSPKETTGYDDFHFTTGNPGVDAALKAACDRLKAKHLVPASIANDTAPPGKRTYVLNPRGEYQETTRKSSNVNVNSRRSRRAGVRIVHHTSRSSSTRSKNVAGTVDGRELEYPADASDKSGGDTLESKFGENDLAGKVDEAEIRFSVDTSDESGPSPPKLNSGGHDGPADNVDRTNGQSSNDGPVEFRLDELTGESWHNPWKGCCGRPPN